MAKYTLPSVGKGVHKIQCAILHEDSLNESYTVKFDNGIIKDVPKSSITELDVIDEALIDTLRNAGRKIKSFAKDLYSKIVYTGKYVYNAILGVPAPSLANTMLASQHPDMDYIGFTPSDDVAAECESIGIEATKSVPDLDDPEILEDINAYWRNVMENFTVAESNFSKYHKHLSINEGESNNKMPELRPMDGDNGHPIINRQEAIRIIAQQFDAAHFHYKTEEAPVLLWGAPGIGKTQIVTSLGDMLSERYGGKVNVITINALGFRKDSFSLPGFEVRKQTFYGSDGQSYTLDIKVPKDFTKKWLPTYDPDMIDTMVEEAKKRGQNLTEEEAERILDNMANGGHEANPETGEEYKEGQGGIIFIDEVSRVAPEVVQVFMKFIQDHELNGDKLGSKWIFVAAANRFTDLSEKLRKQIAWESAWGDRFSQYNFVPSVEEWLNWGREKVEMFGEMQTRLDPDIINFITAQKDLYYSTAYSNSDLYDKSAADRFPNPRSWKAFSDAMRNAKRYGKLYGEEPDENELKAKARSTMGKKAADAFFTWRLGPGKDLPNEVAAKIWDLGVKAKAKKFTHADQLTSDNGAISIIINNHPDILKDLPKDKCIITPKQYENITAYLLSCINEIGKTNVVSTTVGQVAAAVIEKLFDMIHENFATSCVKDLMKGQDDYIYGMQNLNDMKKWEI
jgi:energy-coupling factor transporter ATP-binding protein EcfA2